MKKKIINTAAAPQPIGPYNQAILVDETLYISGQIALDPNTGNLMTDTIEQQTHLVMKNLI
jgi:2-iminobutanoate/2-iminopropanoate deaminase